MGVNMFVGIGSQELASWIFGGIGFVFLLLVFCVGPKELPRWKERTLAIISALLAGLFGFFFTGTIILKIDPDFPEVGKMMIQAGGGCALFVFVLLWWRSQYGRGRNGGRRGKGGDGGIKGELILSKTIEVAEAKGRAELEIEQLKEELAKAVERIKRLEAEGNRPDAVEALEELRKSGDMTRLQELLIKDRDEHRDALVERNREISAVAYLRGDLDVAEEAVNEILKLQPDDMDAVNRKGHIYRLRGELDKADDCYQRVLELGRRSNNLRAQAAGLGNLGMVYQKRGELDKAEEMHRKSLEIEKKLGRLEGMAADYGNLGVIYRMKGELDKAEEMHRKALEIDKKIGRLEGQAIRYGNLGLIYRRRGELDKAEEMHRKSLEIEKKLGRLEGMASDYGNLGLIYHTRGELDKAEKMFRDGLKIDEKLGRLEGMAAKYGNLGRVYRKRGDNKKAKEYWEKAVELYKKIGMPHMVEKVEGWISQLIIDD